MPKISKLSAALLSTSLLALAPSRSAAADPGPRAVAEAPTPAVSPASPGTVAPHDTASGPATPKDGVGMIVGGALSFGAAGLVTGLVVHNAVHNDHLSVSSAILAGGGVVTGGVLLGAGIARHRRYRAYLTEHDLRPPAQGHGLVTAGAMSMASGAIVMTASGVLAASYADLGPVSRQRFWGLTGAGIGAIATGAVLLGVGVDRNRRWRRWRPDRQSVELRPSFAAGPTGAMVGLTGRF